MARHALLFLFLTCASAEVLTPPYFDLAAGKKVTATATCGDEGPELYCKLVGANADQDERVIQGQVCDICDANSESKKHPPEYAVDGMETWWQSPPLSRSMKYNEVNLTIDLGQEFHVAYVFVRMGNSPRPGLWALEKSTDYGKTFKAWQYFSDSPQDCERYFGKETLQPITRDNSVICSTEYSQIVPLEGGEIPISLLIYRPSANVYFNSSELQEWTRATNVRLRLLRTKNLYGHLMSVARQDPTVTRRYFYSIKDVEIGGRCMCNGHADNCDPADPISETNYLVCRCQHNTCGPQCAECCPGFVQKKWRISQIWDRFACEPCNCHNHSTECVYDSEIDEKGLSLDIHGRYDGGGVCQNCQHNTEGINCNKCKSTYFRPYGKRWDEYDVCQPCNCNLHYSTGNCEEETGQCECRPEFNPPNCDSCAYGYFDYPDCKPCICNLNGTDGEHCTPIGGLCPCKYNYAGSSCEVCEDGYYSPECKNCECNSVGSVSTACDKETGNCTCKSKYAGRTCNQCEAGYYSYPTCNHCNCDVSGTQPSICDDVTGQCICKTGFGGARCDQCISGYFMEVVGRSRACVPCNCSTHGSTSTACSADGKCNCLANFGGKQCQQCSPGYYKYPECLPCNCDPSGAIGSTCDDTGLCHCKPNFDGVKCDRCKQQYYNYPACEECNCDPNGVITSFAGCGSVPAGQLCQCKERVQGRICNDCKPLYWNLQEYNPMGCDECDCLLAGTLGGLGTCDTKSGHCTCKLNVGERQCNQCQDGFYNLDSDNMFGCTECDCDVGGSIDNNCNKETGQCRCHSRVSGRRCDQPIRAHYFPNLHQFQYELEEGSTPSGAVRYRNSEEVFPNYSWKGYVVFSMIQNKVINVVYIHKSPLYRLVIKYANPLKDPVTAKIEIVPENVGDMKQEFSVYMRPTINPQLLTVAGEKGLAPVHLVMNPGTWNIIFETDKEVMIDYFILIPEAYYEATVLTKLVDKPCVVGDQALCREFAYPSLAKWLTADVNNLASGATVYISNPVQLEALNEGTNSIPLLNEEQSQLQYNFNIDPPGRYVLLVEYVTPINNMNASNPRGSLVQMRFQSGAGPETSSVLYLNECPYTVPCRQVAVDNTAKIYVFDVEGSNNVVTLESSDEVGIKSITAIPESQWHINYITPRTYSLKKSGQDIHTGFSAAVDAKKVEVESGSGIFRTEVLSTVGNASAVFLNEGDFVRLDGKVPAPGEYLFVLHYFLADSPERTLDVIVNVNKVNYTASLKVEHCPSISGCRVLIVPTSNDLPIPVAENFTIIIKGGSSPDLGLDYVLVIADSDYTDAVLKQSNMLDYTREFINKCAISNYDIGANETGFCRDAMFSITAEYNSGALACACDYSGSTELECNTFGGQCPCKPNVIGRTCNTCKTGFYGFPDCRPCNCPATAICDDNGSCICPKNVIGDKCERCKPYTFNFDTLRGCDECNCDPLGVIGNRLQCQLDTGACDCKENVVGVRCDKCLAGYYAFPECAECNCDVAGTTSDVCDQSTSQCFCKKHVTGQNCGSCKEEYFNLQHDNLDGCTRCHCFGKTTRCASSHLSWAELSGMHNWTLVAIEVNKTLTVAPHTLPPSMLNETVIGAELNDAGAQSVVYFSAPQYYLGKRLTSYGGYLSYSIFYTTSTRDDGSAVSAADVIIGGPNGYIIHESIEQPPSIVEWMHGVRITEKEFRNLDDSPLTRDQLMNVLVNVTSIYIRATYWHKAVTTRLIGVSLEVGVEDYIPGSLRAASVEQCRCPKAYRGLSCEQCAEGYYRLSSGPHAGLCVPCQCHGHATSCDVNTGVCLDCTDNTMGDHCEFCVSGYYGNATEGTPGDCLICACPLLHPSNNFAIGCDLSPDGTLISCDCKPGYDGARCEYCANGYYGNPEILDDYCRPCNCSGNINVSEPGSCDSITGDCLKCVNNTAGAACNLCAPGFYGDAIFSKNCTACICDEYGMERCNPSTGICECRPGVVGAKCDQCLPNHWGLTSGQGCTPCDCGLASESEQCDDTTGQCRCAKGVTGRHCESCAAGYWNYTKEGCDHCNCNSGYSVGFMCNATGQCECLPGVVGEKCDRCPERWVLLPHEGCLECDSCTDALIFTIQNLTNLLANETQEFKDKADSFFTTQRLNYISNQTRSLRPRVDQLKGVEVNEVSNAVKQLETGARNLLRSAEFAATDSENQITRASDLTEEANKVLSQVREQAGKASDVVAHVMELSTGLELSQQPKVEGALAEAQQIMNDIAVKDLTAKKAPAFAAVANTDNQIERMNVFVQPVDEQSKKFEGLVNSTRALKDKLADLLKFTDLAQRTSDEAEKLNIKNKLSKFGNKVLSVTTLNSEAMKDLIDTGIDISNGTYLLTVTGLIVANSNNALEAVNGTNQEMINRLAQLADELPNLKAVRDQALEHAIDVRSRADNLRALAERENNNTRTQHAYSAASAYSSIVQEISDGKKAAAEAEDMINKAVTINDKLNELVGPTHNKSSVLFERAAVALSVTDNQMRPNLTRAEVALENAKATLALANDLNSAVDLSLHPLAKSSLTEQIDKSERVNSTVANTLEIMSQLGADLEASKEWAQGLPKSADEAQKKISTLVNHLNQIKEMEPNITSTQNTVEDEQQRLASRLQEVDKKLQKLREVIEQARTVANRIQVGVTFDRRSTLQPRLPDTVEEMSTSTRVSAYFKTKERDGLLLYLGNPKDTNLRRTKSDDFMVVNIQNGYPYLVMDIGDSAESGRDPVKIGSEKYVADNRWYQLIVDRVGRSVKLSIRETLDNGTEMTHSRDAMLPGQHTIFNLDKQKSKLYVGGAPADARLQDVNYPAFEGQIEELMIGDTPVGLWNFVSADNLNGARQREKMVSSQNGPQEYRFNGRSHVTKSGRGYLLPQKNHVLLFFRTYAPDGLMYLVGDDKHFFSIQMQDGRVYLQVSLGNPEELVIIGTTKMYNDGKWHKLDAGRYTTTCSLKVDEESMRKSSTSSEKDITSLDTMNFGGNNKGIVQVTSKGYDGCMRQISIDSVNIDLTDNVESIGVGYGCQFSSLVSLSGSSSYLRFTDVTTDNVQLTLKFKTAEPDGLLLVYVGRMQTASNAESLSLSMVDGKLKLMSQREQLDTALNTYNDSQWHVVTVTHGSTLRMVVDDFDYFSTDTAPEPLHILSGVLFIGGIQPGYVISSQVGTKVPFKGCIADATLNGRLLNLLEPFSNNSVTFGRCGSVVSTGGVPTDARVTWPTPSSRDVLPTLAPIIPEQETTDREVPPESAERTERPEINQPEPGLEVDRPPTSTRPTLLEPSTTYRPTTTRKPPQPEDGCKLAYDSQYAIGEPEEGYRFGTRNDSRIEYMQLPGRHRDGFDLTITFQTFDRHGGLMFYAASAEPTQFMAVYMKDSKIHYAFNCGGETALVVSLETYNDTAWHTANVVRSANHGKLTVDGRQVGETSTLCIRPQVLAAPFYYGGLETVSEIVSINLMNFYQPFKGCLKGLLMNDKYVTEIGRRVSALRCTNNVEAGIYFGPAGEHGGNYLKLLENNKVGREFSISMEIKPRNSTGLLLSVHGKKDFMVLELLENEVVANVENGKGPFHASYKLSNKFSLCDGEWHKIHAVKSTNVVTVGIDGHFSDAGIGVSPSTDTKSALFIGGHEKLGGKAGHDKTRVRGVKSRRGFTGCIRNIVIGEVKVPIPLSAAHGDTHIGVCPTD